jgi:uncharacterized protein
VIGHAAINGIAGLAILALIGNPNLLLGPLPVGIIGSIGYAIVAVILFFWPGQKVTMAPFQNNEHQASSIPGEG